MTDWRGVLGNGMESFDGLVQRVTVESFSKTFVHTDYLGGDSSKVADGMG